jgi:FimV-like protein
VRTIDVEGWLELRARHFILAGDVSEATLRAFADDLSLFVAVVEDVTNAETNGRVPTRIYLLDDAQFEPIRGSPAIAGHMSPRLEGYFGAVSLGPAAHATREVLLHEYTHFLMLNGRAVHFPRWYSEGFAELLSTMKRRQDLVTLGSPPIGALRGLRRAGELDLEAIFAAERWSDVENPFAFYPQAWAVTHYLNSSAENRERLARFLADLARRQAWSAAYAAAFQLPPEQLAVRVQEHVALLERGVPAVIAQFDGRTLTVDRDHRVRPLPPAEVTYELGRFARTLELWPAAESFFARALELEPAHARARSGLATLLYRRDDIDSGRRELARAIRAAPGDARVRVDAGIAHLTEAEQVRERGDAAAARAARLEARGSFSRAIELAPDDPSAHAGYGTTFLRDDDDPTPGIEALERARALGAWDAGVNLSLARLFVARGDERRARERLEEVARSWDLEAAEEAETLLGSLPTEAQGQAAGSPVPQTRSGSDRPTSTAPSRPVHHRAAPVSRTRRRTAGCGIA